MRENIRKIFKYAICAILGLVSIWQIYLAIIANRMAEMNSFLTKPSLAVFLYYSQPFIWFYLVVTLLLAIDIYRRNDLLILNSICILVVILLGTLFIQLFITLGGYIPILEIAN